MIKPITIPGSALLPGFSVYIIEIMEEDLSLGFYIGMTGDGHYPSARSSFHRLAGHFDTNERSTQNQLGRVLKRQLGHINLQDLTINKYPIHISGFTAIEGATKTKGENHFKSERFKVPYDNYKRRRDQVAALENHLIYLFNNQPDKVCFNKTKGKKEKVLEPELKEIVDVVSTQFSLAVPS